MPVRRSATRSTRPRESAPAGRNAPPATYEHNRLGAVFAPRDMEAADLIAHVMDGSPAYEAGVRSGDVLQKVGDLDVTKWRTDPTVLPLSQKAGSRQRGDRTITASAVLRQILAPDAGAPGKGSQG